MVRARDLPLVEPVLKQILDYSVRCPNCSSELELAAFEIEQGWFTCPECSETVNIAALVNCPACHASLYLDDSELAAGEYVCPDCGETIFLPE